MHGIFTSVLDLVLNASVRRSFAIQNTSIRVCFFCDARALNTSPRSTSRECIRVRCAQSGTGEHTARELFGGLVCVKYARTHRRRLRLSIFFSASARTGIRALIRGRSVHVRAAERSGRASQDAQSRIEISRTKRSPGNPDTRTRAARSKGHSRSAF